MKKKNKKKFHFRLPELTPLNLLLVVLVPILLFILIAIPVLYINEYNAKKVVPFASELESINKKEIVYGDKNTIKDFNFVLYCTEYNNATGNIKFQGLIYENSKTSELIKSSTKINVRLGMFSDWIKVDVKSSNYSKYIATGPRIAKDSSRSRFDFTISGVPTLPKKGNLPFIKINSIPVYAYVNYVATINGTEITKHYVLKYDYKDYIIEAKTLIDNRDIELNVSSTNIQWRYKQDSSWTNSVYINTLVGIEAKINEDWIQIKRKCDSDWINYKQISSLSGYKEGNPIGLDVTNGSIRYKWADSDTYVHLTSESALFELELEVKDGWIRWKRKYETEYKNLKEISTLPDYVENATISVQVNGGNIQWKYSTETSYHNLQTVDSVTGFRVRLNENGNVEWKNEDDAEWKALLINGVQATKNNLDTPIKYGPTIGGIE